MPAIEQRGQKTLGQVTCVVGIGTTPADVGVKRIPVGFTERGERRATSGGVLASGSRNETPSRGFKHEEILLSGILFPICSQSVPNLFPICSQLCSQNVEIHSRV